MTLVKDGKVNLAQDHRDGYRDNCRGISQRRRDWAQLGTKHGHVGIYSQGAGRGQQRGNYYEGTSEVKGFWLN